MPTREALLGQAIEVIMSGASIELSGDRGSGRSRMLERVRMHFMNRSWRTLSLAGSTSFRKTPLMALALAGVDAARDLRPTSVAASVEELTKSLLAGQSLICVDDWDDVDDTTWGVISAVNRVNHTPVVLTRASAPARAARPSVLLPATYAIHLPALRFDEFTAALEARAESRIDPATISRLFGKTNGNIGLALATLDAAVREQMIISRRGLLTAVSSLWTPALSRYLEAFLAPLPDDELDALETLAMLGIADMDAAKQAVKTDLIERLEGRALIDVHLSGSRLLLNLRPAMLVEYFRNTHRSARRVRLSESIPEEFQPVEGVLAPTTASIVKQSPHFARFMHEHQRNIRLTAHDEWIRNPTLGTAVTYINTLHRDGNDDIAIDTMFENSRDKEGTERDRANWLANYYHHRALYHGEATNSISEMIRQADSMPSWGAFLLARAVELQNAFLQQPNLAVLPRGDDRSMDVEVRIAVLRARAAVHTARAELTASDACLQQIRGLSNDRLDAESAVLHVLNLLADAQVSDALRLALGGFAHARDRFDPDGLRLYGYAAAYSAMIAGRLSDVDDVLDTVNLLGAALTTPTHGHLGFAVIGGVLAARRGRRSQLEEAERVLKSNPIPDGPFLGTGRHWVAMQALASTGNHAGAAEVCDHWAETAWESGAYLQAAFAYVSAIELEPTSERLDIATRQLRSVEGVAFADHLDFGRAMVERDAERMLAVAERFRAAERPGLALTAYDHAVTYLEEAGRPDDAARTRNRHDTYRDTLRSGPYDVVRYRTTLVDLTEREREIARLAAIGLTNQEIADDLVLSVRTVESHLHRIMRKTGTERRQQLRDYLDSSEPDRRVD